MIDNLPAAHNELTRAESLLERAAAATAKARATLAEAEAAEREARALVAATRNRVSNIEGEPAAKVELADLTERLRRALAVPPRSPADRRSPTRQRVADDLARLADDPRLTARDKLAKVKQLATDFRERVVLDLRYHASKRLG